MRTQYCRDNIDKVAENCGLSERAVQDVKQAADFCDQYREFSRVSTSAIVTLIRIKEPQIKQKAISFAQSFLNEKTPTGGQKNTDLTANKVREIIKGADMIVRKEYLRDHPEIKEPLSGPKEVDPATVATIAGVPVESLQPINTTEELDAHLKQVYQGARPSDRTGPFTPASEIQKNPGIVDLDAPDTRTKDLPDTLVIKSPPNPVQAPPVLPEFITIVITRGQARTLDNAIKRGDVKADEKAKKDAWQVAAARAFEKGCEIMENGGRA